MIKRSRRDIKKKGGKGAGLITKAKETTEIKQNNGDSTC
jgi:hypothetical protein